MLTFSGIVCNAQPATVIEALPEDSFIVRIGDKDYRALNADKVRELLKQKVDLDAAQKTNAELMIQIRELTLQRDLAHAQESLQKQRADSFEADFKRAREDTIRNFELFQSERSLRIEATQFIPHSSIKGVWGKILNALDHPASQATFKMFIPLMNAARCQ
jgi:hypothetical protein